MSQSMHGSFIESSGALPRVATDITPRKEVIDDEMGTPRRKPSLELPSPHPQLTFKAVVVGCLVGALCSFLALYYGLKTGIIPSLNILSGLAGFVVLKALTRTGVFGGVFTPQENAVVQTTAVATYAASSPGFGFASSYLAMLRGSYEELGPNVDGNRECDVIENTFWRQFLWCIALAFFGLFIVFPLRKYLIIKQRLLFPSGTATAIVIKNLHQSAHKAQQSFATTSKFFSLAFCVNILTWIFDQLGSFPIFGYYAAEKYDWVLNWELGQFGTGLLLSTKVNASLLLGGIIRAGILNPVLDSTVAGPLNEGNWYDPDNLPSRYLGAHAYSLFGGLAIMIVQGAVSIMMLVYILISESFFSKNKKVEELEDLDEDEQKRTAILDQIFENSHIPHWIPIVGYIACSIMCILILTHVFSTPWYQILVGLLLIPIFAVSNTQGIGRTDWDVASSYGKLMMFPIGAWNHGKSIIPSLVAGTVTISGCSNAATLAQDFKTGYLLGATPAAMVVAQFIGQFWGCILTPCLFTILSAAVKLPNSDKHSFITGLYGPIYRTLAVVSAGSGFNSLPKHCLLIALGFILFAVVVDLLEIFGPDWLAAFLPDPTAVAIGLLIDTASPLQFFLGGLIKVFWRHFEPEIAKERIPYIASGCIAGSGVAIVVRVLVTLANLHSPVLITYAPNPQNVLTAAPVVVGVLALLVSLGVAACGLYFWFPPICDDEERDEDTIYDVKRDMSTTSGIELNSAANHSFAKSIK